jgi:hypothetical protein
MSFSFRAYIMMRSIFFSLRFVHLERKGEEEEEEEEELFS